MEDPFVGTVKGVILSINPAVQIVDITHLIPPQDVLQGALVLKASCRFFPPGTIHLAVVDPGVGSSRLPIVIDSPPYIFIGPDNGLFSLVVGRDYRAFLIENPLFMLPQISHTFHGRDIFAPCAGYLSLGVPPSSVGREVKEIVEIELPSPLVKGKEIKGEIISFDHFGNAITNIPGELIPQGEVLIRVGEGVIKGISQSYSEKREGEVLAIIGSLGYLEIAVNRASARHLLHLRKGDAVVLRFT